MHGPTADIRSGDASNDFSPAALQELVAQYHHRLLSLEAELKDQARARALSPRAFAKRVARLKVVHERLTSLQRLCTAESDSTQQGIDIGLPVLDECTPAEQTVCEHYLSDRLEDLHAVSADTGRVYKWLVDAVTGRTGTFRLTLQLSKLRRMIQAVERRTAHVHDASESLSAHIDRVLTASKGGERAKNSLEGLMSLFQQLDGTISRVARLKASVKKEQGKTQAMESWLRQQESSIRAKHVVCPPPSPLALAQVRTATEELRPTYRRKVVRRRKIAEEFWQDVVHNGVRAPTEREIQRAAALIGNSPRAKESK